MDNKFKKMMVVVGLIIAALFLMSKMTHGDVQSADNTFAPGRFILKLKTDSVSASVNELNVRFGVLKFEPLLSDNGMFAGTSSFEERVETIKNRYPKRTQRAVRKQEPVNFANLYIAEVPAGTDIQALCEVYKEDTSVEYCHPDYVMTPQSIYVPDDPYLFSYGSWGQDDDDMWALRKAGFFTDAQGASVWDVSQGENITIAVLDSGVDIEHPDLIDNLWTNTGETPDNHIDDDGNGLIDDIHGWNFEDNNQYLSDGLGHGTFMAGIIGAIGNNNFGLIGVAPQSKIMPVKFRFNFDQAQSIAVSSMVEAIFYAVEQGADVINISWSPVMETPSIPVLEDTIRFAHSLGIVIVVAAGNQNKDASLYSPANMVETITVGGVDKNDQRDVFQVFIGQQKASNFGQFIDVVAPSEDILTLSAYESSHILALIYPDNALDGYYFRAEGTSVAAPFVSGLAALILSKHPDFTNEDVRQIIRVSADDVETPGFDLNTGYGRINALRALSMEKPPTVLIEEPMNMSAINRSHSVLAVKGAAYGPNFKEYQLSYRRADQPDNWIFFEGPVQLPVNGEVNNDVLLASDFDVSALELGDYLLRLSVATYNGLTFEDTVQFTLMESNLPPVFDHIMNQVVEVKQTLMLYVTAHDPDGDPLVYTADNMPIGATFATVEKDGRMVGLMSWTPERIQVGTYSVQFTVSDGKNEPAVSDPVLLTVKSKNLVPHMMYARDLFDQAVIWRGFDKENHFNLKYSYRVNGGGWSTPSTKRFVLFRDLVLAEGKHTIEVKAIDEEGLESKPKEHTFKVGKDKKDPKKDKMLEKIDETIGQLDRDDDKVIMKERKK